MRSHLARKLSSLTSDPSPVTYPSLPQTPKGPIQESRASHAYPLRTGAHPRMTPSLKTLVILAGLLLSCQRVETPVPQKAGPIQAAPVVSNSVIQNEEPPESHVLSTLSEQHTSLTQLELERLARTIIEESERHDFEPELILAVIFVESGGRPSAVSHVGALGLMQIMPPTGAEVARRLGVPWEGPSTLLDPVINVKLGVAYLRTLKNRYADMSAALAAYNWGPGRIDRRLRKGQKLPTEYTDRVSQAYERQTQAHTRRS